MSRGEKLSENEKMLKCLKAIKIILKNMQWEIEIGEEMSSYMLPQMVKFKKRYLDINMSKEDEENEKLYKYIYNLFLGYYEFHETKNGSEGVKLRSEALLKDDVISKKLMKKIKGKSQCKPFEKILVNIQNQKRLFYQNLEKLNKIEMENEFPELDDLFDDYLGTLSFDNICSLNRFNKALNNKIADLELN